MRKLFYMGLESYESRYTLQLTEWAGLTDEEVEKIVNDSTFTDYGHRVWCNGKNVSALVEAMLKEKNT